VKTPYTLFADNDDFILNDSLAESIRFLDAHQDYASCGGRPVLLHLRKRSPSTPTEMLTGNRIHLRQAPQGRNNVAESAHERIRHGLEYYYDYGWYNVHRTQALVPIFREAIRINFDRIFFLEHLLSAGIAKFGKASYDAPAHWVRQEGTSMGTGSSVQEQDDIILASLLPFWGANVAELVGSIVALAEPLNPVDRADFEISVRRMLARIIRTMYAYSLAPSPAYKRVLDRMGIRDTTLWRGLRQCAIKSVEAYTYHDLLFTQRLQTREILRRQPEVGNVLRFLGGSACEWLRLAASGECKP
jgi:hypothetical protein